MKGSCLFNGVTFRKSEVHGIKSRSSLFNSDRIDYLYQDPRTHQAFIPSVCFGPIGCHSEKTHFYPGRYSKYTTALIESLCC